MVAPMKSSCLPRAGAESDLSLSVQLAEDAGGMLLELQRNALHQGWSAKRTKSEGDSSSQMLLAAGLQRFQPSDHVLSEEATDNLARLKAERVWIIDPLDGTREFSEGRRDWAVHVALWCNGQLTAAAVGLPGLRLTLDSSGGRAAVPRHPGPLRLAVSRSRPPELVNELAATLRAELRPMGSAGYKVSAVVRGEVDAYVHSGGQFEWDSAAPVAVAEAAGLHASRIDGSPLVYNQVDPYLPDLLVCRPEISDLLLEQLRRIGKESLRA